MDIFFINLAIYMLLGAAAGSLGGRNEELAQLRPKVADSSS
jgi:hypothetical protein